MQAGLRGQGPLSISDAWGPNGVSKAKRELDGVRRGQRGRGNSMERLRDAEHGFGECQAAVWPWNGGHLPRRLAGDPRRVGGWG